VKQRHNLKEQFETPWNHCYRLALVMATTGVISSANRHNEIDPAVLEKKDPDPIEFLLYFSNHGQGAHATVEAYNKSPQTANNYDTSIRSVGYSGPKVCADMAAGVVSQIGDRSKVKVIDIAAGTGAIGKSLQERGFTDITAHDGAETMLDFCKSLSVYRDYICCLMKGVGSLPCADDIFDVATVSGSFIPDHIPAAALEELVRIVKPGGFIINVYRDILLQTDYGKDYDAVVKSLTLQGKIEQYGRLFFTKYNYEANGHVDIFQVC